MRHAIVDSIFSMPSQPDVRPASTNLDEVRKSIAIITATGKLHTSSLLRYAVPLHLS